MNRNRKTILAILGIVAAVGIAVGQFAVPEAHAAAVSGSNSFDNQASQGLVAANVQAGGLNANVLSCLAVSVISC